MTDIARRVMAPRWRVALWGLAAAVLLVPLVAMQFTRDVAWDGADFIMFGAMLVVACGAFELVVRASRHTGTRVVAGMAILSIFLLVWAELAVGIFH